MRDSTKRAVETLLNGNRSEFKRWAKSARKLDILDAIQYYKSNENECCHVTDTIRDILEAPPEKKVKYEIRDWANNLCFFGITFYDFDDALEYLESKVAEDEVQEYEITEVK